MRNDPLLYVFRRDTIAPSAYDTVLFGVFRAPYAPDVACILVLIGLVTAVACAGVARRRAGGWLWAAYAATGVAFTALTFLVSDPWDEVFINLRHSDYLAEYGSFSFQRHQPVEGIVDFLPYFVLGLLHKLGAPLFDSSLLMSLAGGLACLGAMVSLQRAVGMPDHTRALACAGLSLLPPLAYNAGQGFATTLLAAAALWSAQLLFFAERPRLGFCLLATIPLIRLEGALFVALFWGLWAGQQLLQDKQHRVQRLGRALLIGVALAVPTLLLTTYRLLHYGSAVPAPVRYKSTLGSLYYFQIGLENLQLDLIGGGALGFIVVCAVSFGLLFGGSRASLDSVSASKARLLMLLTGAFLVYVLPYYVSGGDWFPHYWGRYMLPFTVFSAATAVALSWLASTQGTPRRKQLAAASAALVLLGYLLPVLMPSSADYYSPLAQLWRHIDKEAPGRGDLRVQRLSQVGLHLGATTRPDDVIASSELATVMFHAKRDALDLLGVTNEAIIAEPLVERPLPFAQPVVHRRKTPDLIARARPAIVFPYDFYVDGMRVAPQLDDSDERVTQRTHTELVVWHEHMTFRGMRPQRLFELGYTVLVAIQRDFAAMYFVSKDALQPHLRRLKQQGFVQTLPPPTEAAVHAAAAP